MTHDDPVTVARDLAAIAQNGLHYATDGFDRERYTRVRAIAASMMARATATPLPAMEAVLAAETGHATTKVDVRGWVGDGEGRVLLVREAVDGLWTLPGGWAEPHTTPSEAVTAEIREEAGVAATPTRLLACFDRDLQEGAVPLPHRVFKLVFACEARGAVGRGESMSARETTDVGWFDPAAPPPLSLGRITGSQLRRLAAVVADPAAPALFD